MGARSLCLGGTLPANQLQETVMHGIEALDHVLSSGLSSIVAGSALQNGAMRNKSAVLYGTEALGHV